MQQSIDGGFCHDAENVIRDGDVATVRVLLIAGLRLSLRLLQGIIHRWINTVDTSALALFLRGGGVPAVPLINANLADSPIYYLLDGQGDKYALVRPGLKLVWCLMLTSSHVENQS